MAGGRLYEFGPFRLDPSRRILYRAGRPIPLTSKALETLLYLVENHGRAISKEELIKAVWPDTFVEEGNLTQNISTLRKTLGESSTEHAYIETIPKVGYRFVAGVAECAQTRWLAWRHAGLAALFGLVVVAAALWLFFSRTPSMAPSLLAVPLTSYPGEEWMPSFSPDANQVAFAWNGADRHNFDIYAKLVGTDQPLRLTSNAAEDLYPAWSPDGRHIAFARSLRPKSEMVPLYPRARGGPWEIFLVPAIGGPERKLADIADLGLVFPRRLLAWSPAGDFLVLTDRATPDERPSLFRISVSTGEKSRLTNPGTGNGDYDSAVSPDGRTLVFCRSHSFRSDLYLLPVGPDLTPRGEPRLLPADHRVALSPAWTPDSLEIVFASGQELSGGFPLFRMSVAGTAPPRGLEFAGDRNDFPAISRSGQLAWARLSWQQSIWTVALPGPSGKGTPPRPFLASTGINGNPQFSPDGRRVSFLSNRSGPKELWVCDGDGNNPLQLTSLRAPVIGTPRWSPDGEWIVFDSNHEGQEELYVVNSQGGPARRITTNPAGDFVANWSRDGRWIYFVSTRSGESELWKVSWTRPSRTGEPVQVTRKGGYMAFESFDGRFLYYSKLGQPFSLWKLPVEGGEETRVLEAMQAPYFAVAREGIYFIPRPDPGKGSSIHFLSFTTAKAAPVVTIEGWPDAGVTVSPDGRTLLFSQIDHQSSDLMLASRFR